MDATSVAQSLVVAPMTQASEQPLTINQSATFLGMPREIRDLIYRYVFPNITSHRVHLPAKLMEEMDKLEAADVPVKKVFCKLVTWDQPVSALIKKHFMISRQIRNEILPVYYKQYVFRFIEDECDLPRFAAWLQHLSLEQLKLVQNLQVRVCLEGDFSLPLRWIQVEEEISKKRETPMTIAPHSIDDDDRRFWILAYSNCMARRLAGVTWDQIRELTDDINDEIEDQLHADDDEDGHGSGSDDDSGSDEEDWDEEAAFREDCEDMLEAWADMFAPEIAPILREMR